LIYSYIECIEAKSGRTAGHKCAMLGHFQHEANARGCLVL